METTMYNEWLHTADKTCLDAFDQRDMDTIVHINQIMKAIAYALWKDKIRLQNNAARTILLWNRRVQMRWWFDDQTRHQQNGPVVTSPNDEQLYNDGGMYANDGGSDNCGLYDCGNSGPYKDERVYDNKWSILPLGPSNKQQCKKIATVARACVDNTTINNGTSAAHRRSKLIRELVGDISLGHPIHRR